MTKHRKLSELEQHSVHVVDALLRGRLVPFLGAGVNLCDRPRNLVWEPSTKNCLPAGNELAQHLAKEFHYPAKQLCPHPDCPIQPKVELDLARVAQHVVTVRDGGPLNDAIRDCFVGEFSPTGVHHLLAAIASRPAPRAKGEHQYPLIVTTNYDDLMEQALNIANQPYDLVFFQPGDRPLATFWHLLPSEERSSRIVSANTYSYPFCQSRPTILKIHGTIDRTNEGGGSFVITEDQYIEYLAQQPLERLLPPRLLLKMRANHLWFLGYSLRDWNFRVFLHKLKTENPQENYRSWAVLLNSDDAERKFWFRNDVEIIDAPLNAYFRKLQKTLDKVDFP